MPGPLPTIPPTHRRAKPQNGEQCTPNGGAMNRQWGSNDPQGTRPLSAPFRVPSAQGDVSHLSHSTPLRLLPPPIPLVLQCSVPDRKAGRSRSGKQETPPGIPAKLLIPKALVTPSDPRATLAIPWANPVARAPVCGAGTSAGTCPPSSPLIPETSFRNIASVFNQLLVTV
jgi:hypothetical protein